ncbi:unnamed protein product, partial [Linum tenue]
QTETSHSLLRQKFVQFKSNSKLNFPFPWPTTGEETGQRAAIPATTINKPGRRSARQLCSTTGMLK